MIAILSIMFLLRCILSLSLSEENPEVFIWIVDFSYFINARIHVNTNIASWLIVALISQYLHYKNYTNNKHPNYLKPFQMMSGFVSPQSIGLTDRVQIIQFIKKSKRLLLITHIITSKLNPISLFILLSFPMIINCPLIVLILYVMPITVVLTLIIYFASNFNYYQLVYFGSNWLHFK